MLKLVLYGIYFYCVWNFIQYITIIDKTYLNLVSEYSEVQFATLIYNIFNAIFVLGGLIILTIFLNNEKIIVESNPTTSSPSV